MGKAQQGMLGLMSRPGLSRFVGRLAGTERVPTAILQAALRQYVSHYNVDTSEMLHPLEHYDSFDAFFTRQLKPGVHTIDGTKGTAVCPVDGRVLSMGRVAQGKIDQVKGKTYRVEELLDSSHHAERFLDGHFITVYLSPRDYHRIHCPVDGKITGFRYVPGRLYPVNELGVNNVDRLFAVNERITTYIQSPLGEFAVVMVGATNVGKITLAYHDIQTNCGVRTAFDENLKKKKAIRRGDELGMFHLGSTVVVLSSRPDVAPRAGLELEDYVRVGQPLFETTAAA